jgi:hypothetical protein
MPTCALCRNERNLELSHIVPRFVAKRLKADSPNPFMRNSQEPNLRVQDAPKKRLLCRQCEERFSRVEDIFARELFTPTMDGVVIDDLVVTRDHREFSASLLWRALVLTLERKGQPDVTDYDDEDWIAMERQEAALRAFLLGQADHPAGLEYHLFNARSTTESEQPGINALMNLTTGVAIRGRGDAPERLYGIVFLNGLLLVGLVRSTSAARAEWEGGSTRMRPGDLWRNHHQGIQDGYFGELLLEMAQQLVDKRGNMSEAQPAVVRKAIEDIDFEEWSKTAHGRAVIQDHLNKLRERVDDG